MELTAPSAGTGSSSVAPFVLKRDVDSHAVARHLAVLDRDVEAVSLGNTQIPQGLRGGLDRVAGSRLPRFTTDTNQLGHAVDAVSHPHAPSLELAPSQRDYCRLRHLLSSGVVWTRPQLVPGRQRHHAGQLLAHY